MAEKIKLTFLGTSAQIPTAKRNPTAILLKYKDENILVDCGEGTQMQFRKARLNPCKITKILITHKHGDHVFGLPGLISTLEHSGYSKDLLIYCPKGVKKFIENFLDAAHVKRSFKILIKEVYGKFFENDDFYLEAEKMEHGTPINAYSFVIKDKYRINVAKLRKTKIPSGPLLKKLKEGKDIVYMKKKYLAKNLTYVEKGKKISFVLDTLDNQGIVPFVKDSDLFVCDSTFCSDLNDKAREYEHMTSKQAGQIAKKAKVKKLILTHISSRYEKDFKKVLQEAKKVFKNSVLVKDLDIFEL